MVVMGVLSAIALPSMIRQVGKARETEAINNLSSVSFAQQGYFFEYREFAPTYAVLGLNISPQFFVYPEPTTTSSLNTKSQAISIEAGALNSSRNYAQGTYYDNTAHTYRIVTCQSPNTVAITQAPDDFNANCINGVNID
jgi:type II secretory pathway pseudopilin PulG